MLYAVWEAPEADPSRRIVSGVRSGFGDIDVIWSHHDMMLVVDGNCIWPSGVLSALFLQSSCVFPLPGSRRDTATFIALAWLLPMVAIHLAAALKTRLDLPGHLRLYLLPVHINLLLFKFQDVPSCFDSLSISSLTQILNNTVSLSSLFFVLCSQVGSDVRTCVHLGLLVQCPSWERDSLGNAACSENIWSSDWKLKNTNSSYASLTQV